MLLEIPEIATNYGFRKPKNEPSWMQIGNKIEFMLKMAYGVEIYRFLIQFHDVLSFWGSMFEAKIDRNR